MKVLWVCNIMLPIIAQHHGAECSNKEGWLSGLCDALLERHGENGIELHVAYPVNDEREDGSSFQKIEVSELTKGAVLYAHGFYEDIAHAEKYDSALEQRLGKIMELVEPDVIHCFGTEFAHSLAVAKCCKHPERLLVGIQGLCKVIAEAYMADLPEEIQRSRTFRDWLKQDSIRQQQEKFAIRGEREVEIVRLAGNITGRTHFDRHYTELWNPAAKYFSMNETLRGCFYEGQWKLESCEPHTIFLSQGDYPLKGLHYLIMAVGELRENYPDIRIKVAGNSIVNYSTIKDKIKISAYGAYLRSLMKKYELQDRVHFLGRLTAEEMKAQYLSSGLFVCCSSNENSPNSLGEAMLLGVPCVAADVGGISTIFTHGKDGILYSGYCTETITSGKNSKENSYLLQKAKSNKCYLNKSTSDAAEKPAKDSTEIQLKRNVYNLQQAIVQMWENPVEMQEYCKNARNHARKNHDKEANYQKMTEIYAKIAAGREE